METHHTKEFEKLFQLELKAMKLGILIKLETKEKELKVLNQLNTDLLHQVEVLRRSLKSERDLREFNYKLIVKASFI